MSVIKVRAVTVKEFTDWIKDNLHMTWWRGKGGGFDFGEMPEGKKRCPVFKYFYPAIDMRDGKIFHIGTSAGAVDFRDNAPEGAETILDLLEAKFEEKERKYDEEPSLLHKKLMAKFGEELDFDQVKKALKYIASDCTEELWESKGGYDIDYKKKHFTYYDMREKMDEVIERL